MFGFVAPDPGALGILGKSFKISLRGGELRVRKLPWMAGNKKIETQRGHSAQCRCGGKEGEEVKASMSVNCQWVERASLGNCQYFVDRGQRTWRI